MLKRLVTEQGNDYEMTLVSESSTSYYSGMLPGSVSGLYTEKDLQIELEPLAIWSGANFIESRVKSISGNDNLIELENGNKEHYDVLVVNIGSKTKDTLDTKGVWEHALTTRPINDLLPKILKKE